MDVFTSSHLAPMSTTSASRQSTLSTVQYTSLPESYFPSEVAQSIAPHASGPTKMMASMGVLPSPPHITLAALYQLTFDPALKTATTAADTVGNMPPELLVPALRKIDQPAVIDWIASLHLSNDKILTAVSRNKLATPETIAAIALRCSGAVADVIATNQTRLLSNPEIITALAKNPESQLATLNTIYELAQREKVALDPEVAIEIDRKRQRQDPNAVVQSLDPLADFVEERGIDHDTFCQALTEQEKQVEKDLEEQEAYEKMTRVEKEEATSPLEEGKERELPAFALILNMSIAQKMQYLTQCGSEALNILVRDPNRLIHEAAVRSPRVRPIDVARWAKDKGLPDSVLSYIASRRDWIRSYEVLYNLVCNPRTPLADAMNLINHVRTNDLRNLQRNRNVSSNISRQAGILYKKRSGSR